MKTIQKGKDIKRLPDDEAEFQVKNRGYKYVPKSVYKEATRPAKAAPPAAKEDPKS